MQALELYDQQFLKFLPYSESIYLVDTNKWHSLGTFYPLRLYLNIHCQ